MPSTPRDKDVCLMTHCFSMKNQVFLCVLGVFARDKITLIYPPDQGKSHEFKRGAGLVQTRGGSERNIRACPFFILAGLCPGNGCSGIAPAIAGIPPWTAPEEIQYALAACIKPEKEQYQKTLPRSGGSRAADYLVIVHAAVG